MLISVPFYKDEIKQPPKFKEPLIKSRYPDRPTGWDGDLSSGSFYILVLFLRLSPGYDLLYAPLIFLRAEFRNHIA